MGDSGEGRSCKRPRCKRNQMRGDWDAKEKQAWTMGKPDERTGEVQRRQSGLATPGRSGLRRQGRRTGTERIGAAEATPGTEKDAIFSGFEV